MTRIAAVALILLFACSPRPSASITPVLSPPASAQNVKHSREAGFERVTYSARVEFPPKALIEEFAARAKALGWTPLARSVFNKDESSAYVEGWRKRVVAAGPDAPRRWAYIWWSQWTNDRGDILDAVFSYEYPRDGKPNLSLLFGSASVVSNERLLRIGATEHPVVLEDGARPVTDGVIEEPDLENTLRKR